MKTRFGYVSNSSSSSFVVYGNKLDTMEEIEAAVAAGRNVVMAVECGGSSGDNGDFIARITPERYALMKRKLQRYVEKNKDGDEHCIDFVDCAFKKYLDEDEEFDEQALGLSGGEALWYDRDYNSPHSDDVDDDEWLYWLGNFMCWG